MEGVDLKKEWEEHKKGDKEISPDDAEYHSWVGVIERHPQTYQGVPNDLATIPKRVLPRLAEKFECVKNYLENPPMKKSINEFSRNIKVFTNKRDLAQQFFILIPFFYDKSRNWWLWDDEERCWGRVDETDILNAVESQARINTIPSKEKNEILEALKQEGRKNIPNPVKPTWIQFKGTIIDIETGEKFDASPEYFVTNPIPWELQKEGFMETPIMDKIFEEWVGKDYVKTLHEILAYCLLPDYPIHRIFCFYGSGLNGKSKFFELLRNFIGNHNCASTELDTLINSRFEATYRLHKKLVCQIGETNFSEMSKTSMLKKLSGGDLIGFEYKNKDAFEEKNYAKIMISTNNLPTTTDKTIGFYRRWSIIDFPNTFSEKKDILGDIPEEEYECLALKTTVILKDLLSKRSFHKEGTIDERMKKYEDYSDPLGKFVQEFIEQSSSEYITKNDFLKKLNAWCKENRHREMAENTVGKKMKEKGIEGGRKYVEWLHDGKGGQLNVWIGVQWKS